MGYITYHGNVGTAQEVPVTVPVDADMKTLMFRRAATGQMAWQMDNDGEVAWAYLHEIDETGDYYKRTEHLVDDGEMVPTLAAMEVDDFKTALAGIRDIKFLRKIAKEIVHHSQPERADMVMEQIQRMKKVEAMYRENDEALEAQEASDGKPARKPATGVNSRTVKEAVKLIKKDSSAATSRGTLAEAMGVNVTEEEYKEIRKQIAS